MENTLSSWSTFESQLAKYIQKLSDTLVFTAGYQCIPGYPSDGFRADAALTNGRVLVAIEVEARQTHPDTNVGKYWLLSKYHKYEKVVLFHVYTPAYNSYGWRKQLGEFYAEKMEAELPFEYILLDRRQAIDINQTFAEVCDAIEYRVRQEFSGELSA